MRFFLHISLPILLLVSLMACHEKQRTQDQASKSVIEITEDSASGVTPVPPIFTAKDSLKLDSLQLAAKALSKPFTLKQQDFEWPTYYHKNWWGRYYLKGKALMAGTDTLGNLFMVGCNSVGMPSPQVRLHTAMLIAGEDTMVSARNSAEIKIDNIGVSVIEAKVFDDSMSVNMLKRVAGTTQRLRVRLRGDAYAAAFALSERDRKGIQETVALACVLEMIDELREKQKRSRVASGSSSE